MTPSLTPAHPALGTALTSLPRGMPLPRAHVSPITLATKVLKVRYSFSTTPLRMVFISGIPEPGTTGTALTHGRGAGDTGEPLPHSSEGDP